MKYTFLPLLFISTAIFTQTYASCNTTAAVQQADQIWATALATHNPKTITNQYAKGAVLLATYENNPITTQTGIKNYFTSLFQTIPQLQVHYNKEIIYTFPGGAVSSGLYTFSGKQNGKVVSTPGRFTFVYEATPNGCLLIAHHSSVLPVRNYPAVS
ncbi:MAG: hypothetical protein A3E87_06915 [Gammaproteobacteria bacterium RIFCSPHIGHO2_12_FULL_35_23]|nr:MAG: hypothetical protein A3E87_06915 [Gammaproteobacteria bacterium RIFCSPHIGHO2_12_FULL_35_23]